MSPWPDPAELLPAGLAPCSHGSNAQAGPTPYLGPGSTGQDRAALSSCQTPEREEGQRPGRVLGPGRVPGLGWHRVAAAAGAPRDPVCLCFGASLYLTQPKGWCHCLSCYTTNGVASIAQHSQQGTARRQSGSWGLQGDLQPTPHETMEKTPCFCPMTHLHQKEWLWGHHTCCHPIPHSSLPRAGTGTHHALSALPASWQWLQHWPKECSTAGRVQDGQAG